MSSLSHLATNLLWVRVGAVICARDVKMEPAVGRNKLCVFPCVSPLSLEHRLVSTVMTVDGMRTVLLRLVELPEDYIATHGTGDSASPCPFGICRGGNTTDTGGRCGFGTG